MQRALARQAAIERQLSNYLHLECGHLQTYETFQAYRFAAKVGVTYCEECEDTIKIAKPPKRPPLPETPMFLWRKRLLRDVGHKDKLPKLYEKIGNLNESNKPGLYNRISGKAYGKQELITRKR